MSGLLHFGENLFLFLCRHIYLVRASDSTTVECRQSHFCQGKLHFFLLSQWTFSCWFIGIWSALTSTPSFKCDLVWKSTFDQRPRVQFVASRLIANQSLVGGGNKIWFTIKKVCCVCIFWRDTGEIIIFFKMLFVNFWGGVLEIKWFGSWWDHPVKRQPHKLI